MSNYKILVIDDDPTMLDLAKFHFQSQGYEVVTAGTGTEALKLAEEQPFDIALIDFQLPDPDLDGIEVVKRLKETLPEAEIIMISGYGSVTKAVEATKAGAFFFVEKPVEFEELMVLMQKALEHRQQAEEIKQLRGRLTNRTSYYNIIGSSKAMQNIYEIIDGVAESDANILIIGESGTGKELIANAVHYKSLRSKRPFVKINCSALPKELIESELFGHTKGAFTGAASEKNGLISRAEGGSLLLDEIGEMPLELQPKLLRVLQERVYYRIGSERAQEANFRLISATNRNPLDAVRDGHLREDLYYRINTIEIRVPPLRQRAEDIPHLAEHFLREFAEKYGRPVRSISQQAYARLFAYHWPGNVRELQNILERTVLLCKGETIEAADLPFAQTATVRTEPEAINISPEDLNFEQIGKIIISKLPEPRAGIATVDLFKQLEGILITAALERTKGNKQAAANLLGVYRPRLYGMLRRHKLQGAGDGEDNIHLHVRSPRELAVDELPQAVKM